MQSRVSVVRIIWCFCCSWRLLNETYLAKENYQLAPKCSALDWNEETVFELDEARRSSKWKRERESAMSRDIHEFKHNNNLTKMRESRSETLQVPVIWVMFDDFSNLAELRNSTSLVFTAAAAERFPSYSGCFNFCVLQFKNGTLIFINVFIRFYFYYLIVQFVVNVRRRRLLLLFRSHCVLRSETFKITHLFRIVTAERFSGKKNDKKPNVLFER